MSETANLPPGLRTRKASEITLGLSVERLMTQLEITTSTWSFGQRDLLDVALEELHVLDSRLGLVFLGQLKHFVGHIQTVSFPSRRDPPGREQHVYAAAASEV